MSPLTTLIQWPWLALLPAAAFAALHLRRRRRWVLAATMGWLLYFFWESSIKLGFGCPAGDCSIRVDLLIIYPALPVLSMFAIVAAVRASRVK